MIRRIFLAAAILLAVMGCNVSDLEPGATSQLGFTYAIPAIVDQELGLNSKGIDKAVRNYTGSLEVYDSNAPTLVLDTIPWYATVDENLFTITSNKTIALEPGTYNFKLTLTKGDHAYFGETINQTIGEGDNALNITLNPVIGDTGVGINLTQLTNLTFNYADVQYADISAPKLGYILDG
jgi:hypothetical protein